MAMVGGTIYAWGRIASAFINTAMLNSYFLLILAPPVFGHIFHREKTLRKFLDALHSDGLVAQEARLGNAHKQLYGMDEGTDTYISASGTGPNKSSASQVPPENTATYFTYNNTFSQQQDKATGVQFSRVEDDYMFESDHELAYAMPSPFNAPQPMDYDHNTRIL
ncbi:hypothetical protein FBU59_006304 [Linderina macrospora]|uniref:Uncharacterized protein n=1 Tax=Linderina macrospora TaxID=4868 RepID=A0ACC1J0E0_9FUNG|nr:hypothetical protein FBU59_006304 [Linderina macrospora]